MRKMNSDFDLITDVYQDAVIVLYEETKDEDGDDVYKITVKNKKGELFKVIFFDEELDLIGIEKEHETLFYTN